MGTIKLVISDVDGTLVTNDKRLTEANRRAVAALAARGIGFTIVSSRPPFGMRMLLAPLSLKLPIGAFNGGVVVDPSLAILEQHLIPRAAAAHALDVLRDCGVVSWMFTPTQWIAITRDTTRVAHEQRTIRVGPVVVDDASPYLSQLGKIVGVSDDFERLARCEAVAQAALGAQAHAVRSQSYYLDITAPGVDKGAFVGTVSRLTGIEPAAIAVLGDMPNDLPMFARAGIAIAMGNAPAEVQRAAHYVTLSNEQDGLAAALARYVL